MICLEHDLSRINRNIRFDDKPVTEWSQEVTFLAKGKKAVDVPFSATGWVLFSDRLKSIVERNGVMGVVFHPVQVISDMIDDLPSYWYAHLSTLHGAIDLENSTYDYLHPSSLPNPVLMMIKPVLKRGLSCRNDLFRLGECSEVVICSQKFRNIFIENDCTGFNFQRTPLT
jgi:hypothetical protein